MLRQIASSEMLADAVGRWSERHGLTRREQAVFVRAMAGQESREIQSSMRIKASTYKGLVRSLLRRVGVARLDKLLLRVHEEAWNARGSVRAPAAVPLVGSIASSAVSTSRASEAAMPRIDAVLAACPA
jgi:DNA-binding CsgD family transcriptional regulator